MRAAINIFSWGVFLVLVHELTNGPVIRNGGDIHGEIKTLTPFLLVKKQHRDSKRTRI